MNKVKKIWVIPIVISSILSTSSLYACRWVRLTFENATSNDINFSIDKGSVTCIDNCTDPAITTSTNIMRDNMKSCAPTKTYPYSTISLGPRGTKTVYVYAYCGLTCWEVDSTFNGTFTDSNGTKIGTLTASQKVHHDWTVTANGTDTHNVTSSTAQCKVDDTEIPCATIKIID